ncbi:hypothetical protein HK102_013248, partial [Quaeritorhiza haematococci]
MIIKPGLFALPFTVTLHQAQQVTAWIPFWIFDAYALINVSAEVKHAPAPSPNADDWAINQADWRRIQISSYQRHYPSSLSSSRIPATNAFRPSVLASLTVGLASLEDTLKPFTADMALKVTGGGGGVVDSKQPETRIYPFSVRPKVALSRVADNIRHMEEEVAQRHFEGYYAGHPMRDLSVQIQLDQSVRCTSVLFPAYVFRLGNGINDRVFLVSGAAATQASMPDGDELDGASIGATTTTEAAQTLQRTRSVILLSSAAVGGVGALILSSDFTAASWSLVVLIAPVLVLTASRMWSVVYSTTKNAPEYAEDRWLFRAAQQDDERRKEEETESKRRYQERQAFRWDEEYLSQWYARYARWYGPGTKSSGPRTSRGDRQQQQQHSTGYSAATPWPQSVRKADPLGYYALLGLNPGCDQSEIPAAFRTKALELHPDRHMDHDIKKKKATEFRRIVEAYSVLRNGTISTQGGVGVGPAALSDLRPRYDAYRESSSRERSSSDRYRGERDYRSRTANDFDDFDYSRPSQQHLPPLREPKDTDYTTSRHSGGVSSAISSGRDSKDYEFSGSGNSRLPSNGPLPRGDSSKESGGAGSSGDFRSSSSSSPYPFGSSSLPRDLKEGGEYGRPLTSSSRGGTAGDTKDFEYSSSSSSSSRLHSLSRDGGKDSPSDYGSGGGRYAPPPPPRESLKDMEYGGTRHGSSLPSRDMKDFDYGRISTPGGLPRGPSSMSSSARGPSSSESISRESTMSGYDREMRYRDHRFSYFLEGRSSRPPSLIMGPSTYDRDYPPYSARYDDSRDWMRRDGRDREREDRYDRDRLVDRERGIDRDRGDRDGKDRDRVRERDDIPLGYGYSRDRPYEPYMREYPRSVDPYPIRDYYRDRPRSPRRTSVDSSPSSSMFGSGGVGGPRSIDDYRGSSLSSNYRYDRKPPVSPPPSAPSRDAASSRSLVAVSNRAADSETGGHNSSAPATPPAPLSLTTSGPILVKTPLPETSLPKSISPVVSPMKRRRGSPPRDYLGNAFPTSIPTANGGGPVYPVEKSRKKIRLDDSRGSLSEDDFGGPYPVTRPSRSIGPSPVNNKDLSLPMGRSGTDKDPETARTISTLNQTEFLKDTHVSPAMEGEAARTVSGSGMVVSGPSYQPSTTMSQPAASGSATEERSGGFQSGFDMDEIERQIDQIDTEITKYEEMLTKIQEKKMHSQSDDVNVKKEEEEASALDAHSADQEADIGIQDGEKKRVTDYGEDVPMTEASTTEPHPAKDEKVTPPSPTESPTETPAGATPTGTAESSLIDGSVEEEKEEEEESDSSQESEKPLFLSIYEENRKKVQSSIGAMKKQIQSLTSTSTSFSSTSSAPLEGKILQFDDHQFLTQNIQVHARVRPALLRYIRLRKGRDAQKRLALRLQYKEYYTSWKRKIEKMEQTKSRKKKSGKNSGYGTGWDLSSSHGAVGGSGGFYGGVASSAGGGAGSGASDKGPGLGAVSGGRSSRRVFTSDTVRSEAEWQDVLASLIDDPNDDSRRYAKEPAQVISEEERAALRYMDRNHLVEDPLSDLVAYNSLMDMVWTEEEKEIFKAKLIQHGKNFTKVAQHLPRKTVNDCVQYYYREKINLGFKQLLKKSSGGGAGGGGRGVKRRTGPIKKSGKATTNQVG